MFFLEKFLEMLNNGEPKSLKGMEHYIPNIILYNSALRNR
ncbi:hypothetical protein RV15_GL002918 [Enterococcus silesiacus]|uniref:Uncharacterized protein n=1 Tax=Enterococcus silesiacus TaxID=332949 RepID=A0AA91GK07_9ENTE|nr:hypothetical protein RV15_GL002918 [Enterococcus silesiacus]